MMTKPRRCPFCFGFERYEADPQHAICRQQLDTWLTTEEIHARQLLAARLEQADEPGEPDLMLGLLLGQMSDLNTQLENLAGGEL